MGSVKKLAQYPGLDWQQCLAVAGNSREIAEELLSLFMNTLAAEIRLLQQAYEEDDNLLLYRQAHRMSGALSYCIFPELKAIVTQLEQACLNDDKTHIDHYYEQAIKALNELLVFVDNNVR